MKPIYHLHVSAVDLQHYTCLAFPLRTGLLCPFNKKWLSLILGLIIKTDALLSIFFMVVLHFHNKISLIGHAAVSLLKGWVNRFPANNRIMLIQVTVIIVWTLKNRATSTSVPHSSLGFAYISRNGKVLQRIIFIQSCIEIIYTLFFLSNGNLNASGNSVNEQHQADQVLLCFSLSNLAWFTHYNISISIQVCDLSAEPGAE